MDAVDRRTLQIIEQQSRHVGVADLSGRTVLSMNRRLNASVERAWAALTVPSELALWSPIMPSRELSRPGPVWTAEGPGSAVVSADVIVCSRPRELVHRWGADHLHWTLRQVERGSCLIRLAHATPERGKLSSIAAGWHICLAVLEARMDGHDVERVVGRRAEQYGWSGLVEEYEAVCGLAAV